MAAGEKGKKETENASASMPTMRELITWHLSKTWGESDCAFSDSEDWTLINGFTFLSNRKCCWPRASPPWLSNRSIFISAFPLLGKYWMESLQTDLDLMDSKHPFLNLVCIHSVNYALSTTHSSQSPSFTWKIAQNLIAPARDTKTSHEMDGMDGKRRYCEHFWGSDYARDGRKCTPTIWAFRLLPLHNQIRVWAQRGARARNRVSYG